MSVDFGVKPWWKTHVGLQMHLTSSGNCSLVKRTQNLS